MFAPRPLSTKVDGKASTDRQANSMPFLQGATIFDYCERGLSPAFWAEPLNAVTNGGFILAALAGAAMIARRASNERSLWQVFFVLNFIAIGVGSFLFHTVPNMNTALADTGPIGIFMLTYLIFALRRLAGANVACHRPCDRGLHRRHRDGIQDAMLGRPHGLFARRAARRPGEMSERKSRLWTRAGRTCGLSLRGSASGGTPPRFSSSRRR